MPSIVVMGVSGCGKTAVGRRIGPPLHMPFHDGDDFHPEGNVAKMSSGEPLDDEDRRPWLDRLGELLSSAEDGDAPVVLACSALKQGYRDRLREHAPLTFLHLTITPEVARGRIGGRDDHFMPADLVQSQFDALELPVDGLTVDATPPLEDVVAACLRALQPPEHQT